MTHADKFKDQSCTLLFYLYYCESHVQPAVDEYVFVSAAELVFAQSSVKTQIQ
jgi:hypothetical protein